MKYLMPKPPLVTSKKYYRLFDLPSSKAICAFSSRNLKNMSLSYGDTSESLKNRENFLKELDIDYRDLVCARQIHANSIKYVQEEYKGKGALSSESAIEDTDAFITDKRNVPLAIFTADCPSLFLYDPKTPAIGLVHAGWRSTRENILTKAIKSIQEKFNTLTEYLYVGFGPAIRSCCYEVGKEFVNFFPGDIIQRDKHYYLDLVSINKRQALRNGVKEINIFDSGICTFCHNEEFFSYRKEGKPCGRQMSVIMLR